MQSTKANLDKSNLTLKFDTELQLKSFEKLYLEFAHTPWEEFLERKSFMYLTALKAIIGQNQLLDGTKEDMVAMAIEAIEFGETMRHMWVMADQDED